MPATLDCHKRCDDCPLAERPLVFGKGVPESFLAVGEAPGKTELVYGEPFVGKSGQLLRKIFEQTVGEQFYLVNSLQCHPEGNETPTATQIQACRDRLFLEIASQSPTKVLLCGNTAIAAVRPDYPFGVTKLRGQPFWLEEFNCYGMATYHPSAVLRSPNLARDFINDVAKAVRLPLKRQEPDEIDYWLICDKVEAEWMSEELAVAKRISLDLETTEIDPWLGQIISVGFYGGGEKCFIVGDEGMADPQVREVLQKILRWDHVNFVAQNGYQFDTKWLLYHLDVEPELAFDTMLAHYTIDERQTGHGLKDQAGYYFDAEDYSEALKPWLEPVPTAVEIVLRKRGAKPGPPIVLSEDSQREIHLDAYLDEEGRRRLPRLEAEINAIIANHEDFDAQQVLRKGPDWFRAKLLTREANYGDIPRSILFDYQARDVYYTWKLVPELLREMDDEEVTRVHDKVLLPAAWALGHVEYTGVRVDREYLQQTMLKLQAELDGVLAELQSLALEHEMEDFNPGSHLQVKKLLYEKLELPGSASDAETLAMLTHPAAKLITDYRQKSKLISTYVLGLLKASEYDGRVHCDFFLIGTETGRLSSREPNLQNIPQLVGPMIRDAFVVTVDPDDPWVMIEADYSQLELRVAGFYSGDRYLEGVYQRDEDIHKMVASSAFKVPYDEVTEEQRYVAKYIDFGVLYGRGAYSLANGELQSTVQEAQRWINNFMAQFSELRDWIREQHVYVRKHGRTQETPFGRYRRFPLIIDENRGDVERQSVNSPIQSMASDICLGALTRLVKRFRQRDLRVLLTVHDSILMEVRQSKLNEMLDAIFEEMEMNIPIKSEVPFKIEAKVGYRWGSLKKVKVIDGEWHTVDKQGNSTGLVTGTLEEMTVA